MHGIFAVKCYHFLPYISDEQEFKVFVDLAMISAGDDDMDIDRISCMHTSCLAFGPLIFGYRQDLGFKELMKLCQLVWQAVDANPNINKKLVSFYYPFGFYCMFLNVTKTELHGMK